MLAQLLKDGTLYEENGLYIKYYTEEQFKKYKESANVIGSVQLIPIDTTDGEETVDIQTQTGIYHLKLYPNNEKEKTFGYLYIDELNFVRIVKTKPIKQKKNKPISKKSKKPVIIVVSITVIACFILGGILFLPKLLKTEEPITPVEEPVTELPVSEETTVIPLYENFTLPKNESKINLTNPKENTVDFIYEIYQDEEVIFTTDKIKPGNQYTVDLSNYFEVGEYDLVFKTRCFIEDKEVNGTEESVKVVIE